MIVEGYDIRECHCSPNPVVEFIEIQVYSQPRFMLTCSNCGNSSKACKTKEQAVNKWNKSLTVLLG